MDRCGSGGKTGGYNCCEWVLRYNNDRGKIIEGKNGNQSGFDIRFEVSFIS